MPTKIDGRLVDGRYKPGIDKGSMSSNRIPLPVKKVLPKPIQRDDTPKQFIRQELSRLNKPLLVSQKLF